MVCYYHFYSTVGVSQTGKAPQIYPENANLGGDFGKVLGEIHPRANQQQSNHTDASCESFSDLNVLIKTSKTARSKEKQQLYSIPCHRIILMAALEETFTSDMHAFKAKKPARPLSHVEECVRSNLTSSNVQSNFEIEAMENAHDVRTIDTTRVGSNVDSSAIEDDFPPSFFCPITHEVMQNPVATADGLTYEKEAIETWLHAHDTSPSTGVVLTHKTLTPNITLRNAIEECAVQLRRQPQQPQKHRDSNVKTEVVSKTVHPKALHELTDIDTDTADLNNSNNHMIEGDAVTPRSLDVLLRWLYTGTATELPGAMELAQAVNNTDAPPSLSPDDTTFLNEVVATADIFQCDELRSYTTNILSGNQFLNPSFATVNNACANP
jgi:hypothetical protein